MATAATNSVDDNESISSELMFIKGFDDIVFEGELMKFKPGLSANFVSRYVQISRRAVRYFRSRLDSFSDKPIVSFNKNLIKAVAPIKINKASYLKKGTRIAQSQKEGALFDNAFEIIVINKETLFIFLSQKKSC